MSALATLLQAGPVVLETSSDMPPVLLPGPKGLLVKEIYRAGEVYIHPVDGKTVVSFTEAELRDIALSTRGFIAVQGPIPMPDGHTLSSSRNLGFWHDFFVEDGSLYGVCEPGTPEIRGKLGTTIRDVSLFLEDNVRDSKGGNHRNVLTHVCATNYPVATGLKNFVALSRAGSEINAPVFRPKGKEKNMAMNAKLKNICTILGLACGDDMDDDKALSALEVKAKEIAPGAQLLSTERAIALAAKGEVTALASKVTELKTENDRLKADAAKREEDELEGLMLSAKTSMPTPMLKEDEDDVRDLWKSGKKDAARRALARTVGASGGNASAIAAAATAPRGTAANPGAAGGHDQERAVVREIVSSLERGGAKMETSPDGLKYRPVGESVWRTAKV